MNYFILVFGITSKVKRDGLSIEIKDEDYWAEPLEIKSHVRFHKVFLLNESLILSRKTVVKPDFGKKSTIKD